MHSPSSPSNRFPLDVGGDFYRLLADGSYEIKVKKAGYKTQSKRIDVHNQVGQHDAQRLDFVLEPTSSERASLQQIFRRYMDKVSLTDPSLSLSLPARSLPSLVLTIEP